MRLVLHKKLKNYERRLPTASSLPNFQKNMKTNFRFPSGTGCSGRLLHGALHTLAAALLLFAGSACENEDPDVYTPPAPEPLAPLTLVPNMDPPRTERHRNRRRDDGRLPHPYYRRRSLFLHRSFDGNVPADLNVLAFEYQTDRRTDHIQLFFWTEVDGEVIPDVERTIVTTPFEAADTWKEYSVRIRKCREEFFWGEAGNLLRIDFGTVKDADIRLRNLRLREMTDAERAEDAAENENDQNASVYEERLKEYLHASYTSKVDRVEATADKIRITGSYAGEGSFLLYELPPYADITRIETAYQKYATPLTQSPFDVTLDRMASPEGFPYDRLLSQWAVVCRTAEGDRIVSHGRYADEVAALRNLPPVPMRSKKGLGGFYAGDYTSDLDDLGITSATVNVSPLQFVPVARKGRHGRTRLLRRNLLFRHRKLDALDATLRETAARDITVAVILLVDPAAEARDAELGALLQHPDYTRGTYTMPNMTTPQGRARYAAMIDFLAQRCPRGRRLRPHRALDRPQRSRRRRRLDQHGRRQTHHDLHERLRQIDAPVRLDRPPIRRQRRILRLVLPIRGAALRTRAGIPCATWSGCSAISVARKATFAGRSPATVTPRRSPTPVRGANRMRLSR